MFNHADLPRHMNYEARDYNLFAVHPKILRPFMFDLPDDEILPLSREHVFWTWSAQAKVNPIAIKRAKGVYFWDVEDKKYLDFNSMTMCVNLGHGNERVIKAMQDQAAELPYAAPGMTTKVRALASRAVAEITPNKALSKILFTLGGADANENAI